MNLAELQARWQSRRDEWSRLGVLLDGGKLAGEVVADLAQLDQGIVSATVTPAEAARECGYHVESVHRMIRDGRLKNYGTQRRPRVSLAECPRKPMTKDALNSEMRDASEFSLNDNIARSTPASASSPSSIVLDVLSSRQGARQRRGIRRRSPSPRS